MKRVTLRLDAARNVWVDPVSGMSICNWDENAPRERVEATASAAFAKMHKEDVEIVFANDPLSAKETKPQVIKVTNFRKDAAPIA